MSNSDPDRFFRTDYLETDLKGRLVRGGAVIIATQAFKFSLQMGMLVILSRLLTPQDFGLIGMVAVVINFAILLKDLGLSAATLQRAEINHKQISTLFWINVAVSSILALGVAALAPIVAWFYGEPRLAWVTLVLSISFIFAGLTAQHQALLRRQMRFTSLARIEIVSMLVGTIIATVSAWYGAGYWALVVLQLLTAITNAVGVWVACSWRPGLPSRRADIGKMLAFGGNLTGFKFTNYFTRNLDKILIGKYWGFQELGLYTRAHQLILLPIQQINIPIASLALPTLSLLQFEPEQYCRYYYKAILLTTTLGMPVVGFMFVTADKIIPLLFGQQWLDCIPIFQFLIPAAFIGTFNVATGWVYTSLGRTNRQFRRGIVASTVNAIIFLISVRWGAISVAAAYGLSRPFILAPSIIYCYKETWLRLTDLAKTLYRPTVASIGATVALLIINHLLPVDVYLVVDLFIDLVLYSVLYFTIWLILPNGKRTLIELLQLTQFLVKRKPK